MNRVKGKAIPSKAEERKSNRIVVNKEEGELENLSHERAEMGNDMNCSMSLSKSKRK